MTPEKESQVFLHELCPQNSFCDCIMNDAHQWYSWVSVENIVNGLVFLQRCIISTNPCLHSLGIKSESWLDKIEKKRKWYCNKAIWVNSSMKCSQYC